MNVIYNVVIGDGSIVVSYFNGEYRIAKTINHLRKEYSHIKRQHKNIMFNSEFIHTETEVYRLLSVEDRFALTLSIGLPTNVFLTDEEMDAIIGMIDRHIDQQR